LKGKKLRIPESGLLFVSNFKKIRTSGGSVRKQVLKNIGKINELNPDEVVWIGCLYFPIEKAGYYDWSPVSQITRFDMHNHNISLGIKAYFFCMTGSLPGIHSEYTGLGKRPSLPIQKGADQIISCIIQAP